MTLSKVGRLTRALVASVAVGLGMTACGGGTIGFMWVLGTQYNQIVGFKIDQYTGNLTQTVNSPYAAGGVNPVSIALRTGGRYAYVVNKGTTGPSGASNGDGNVAVFAVGNDGILTFEESYSTAGNTPVWAATDGTGNFLYVLDAQAPDYATSGNGDVTVFAIDGNTGRLQLVPNQQIKNAQGQQLNYFEVGKKPTMLRYSGTCLFSLDSGDQTVFPYGVGAGGQLTLEANSTIPTGTINMTSINVSGSSFYVTDAGPTAASPGGTIIPYTIGTNCSLSVQADGPVNNLAGTANPVYSVTDTKNKYLYVLNQKNTNTNTATTNSSISAFTIDPSTGRLQALSDSQNPYAVGNGPVCMQEDPSNQYFYVTSGLDGTVTGKLLNQNTGQLSGLTRGSVFAGTGLETCLVISGNVD